jgi:hypothetical protein
MNEMSAAVQRIKDKGFTVGGEKGIFTFPKLMLYGIIIKIEWQEVSANVGDT